MDRGAHRIFQSLVFAVPASVVQAVTKQLDVTGKCVVFRSGHPYVGEPQLVGASLELA